MLAKGSMHKTVYNMLEGARKDKMDKMRLGKKITTKLRSLTLNVNMVGL